MTILNTIFLILLLIISFYEFFYVYILYKDSENHNRVINISQIFIRMFLGVLFLTAATMYVIKLINNL